MRTSMVQPIERSRNTGTHGGGSAASMSTCRQKWGVERAMSRQARQTSISLAIPRPRMHPLEPQRSKRSTRANVSTRSSTGSCITVGALLSLRVSFSCERGGVVDDGGIIREEIERSREISSIRGVDLH